MRLFVGIELEPPVRASAAAALTLVRRALERPAPDLPVRWIAPANLHLTLAFIGEVLDDAVARISGALAENVSLPAFDLAFGTVGAFPPAGPLRVIWFGVTHGESPLMQLHGQVVDGLSMLGLRFECRPYSPHLTVGRVKDTRGLAARRVREALRSVPVALGPQRVRAVTLFRSRVSSAGSTYDVVMRVPLQG